MDLPGWLAALVVAAHAFDLLYMYGQPLEHPTHPINA